MSSCIIKLFWFFIFQNCKNHYQKVSQKYFGNFWRCCQIEVNFIYHKVQFGLLASGKSKYGTWDSQKQPYTVQNTLGNFRWLKFLDVRFLLGLYCAWFQVISRWTLKVSNLKVYFKSLRDLDLELEDIIAMKPCHRQP